MYRPNAATIITDGNGRVLCCERADLPGAVQTVQGGIDPGETPRQAAERELVEELGIRADEFEMIGELPETFRYDWPAEALAKFDRVGVRRHPEFVGQEQHFFLAKISPDTKFFLGIFHREFSQVHWGTPQDLVDGAWEYKKPVLEAALRGFGLL